jgi:hypothetical protein
VLGKEKEAARSGTRACESSARTAGAAVPVEFESPHTKTKSAERADGEETCGVWRSWRGGGSAPAALSGAGMTTLNTKGDQKRGRARG